MKVKRKIISLILLSLVTLPTFSCASNKKNIFIFEKNGDSYTITGLNEDVSCDELESIVVPDYYNNCKVSEIGIAAFHNENSYKIKKIIIGNNIVKINDYAFSSTSIKSINLPSNIVELGNYIFGYCDELETINIYCNNAIYKMGQEKIDAFSLCKSLKSINLPNGIKYLPNFHNDISLEHIIIPDSTEYISRYAFRNCISLEEINMPDSIINVDCAFAGLNYFSSKNVKLNKIRFPKNLTKFSNGNDLITFEDYFEHLDTGFDLTSIGPLFCNLKTIDISEENSLYTSFGKNCIANKSSHKLLFGCSSTIIDESITSIGKYAFKFDINLSEIYIPKTVKNIDEFAFPNEYDYVINCEASEKPDGWNESWASGKVLDINWGVTKK